MKDFADVPNSSGAFPDVIAIDCTGPGETDGTALIADTLSDDWAWKQALLEILGDTPDGVLDSGATGQLLTALQDLIIYPALPMALGQPNGGATPAWAYDYSADKWTAAVVGGYVTFPLRFRRGTVGDVYVDVYLKPAAARTGTDRVGIVFAKKQYGSTSLSTIYTGYDDGTTNEQTVTATDSIDTTDADTVYFVAVKAGAATTGDIIHGLRIRYS